MNVQQKRKALWIISVLCLAAALIAGILGWQNRERQELLARDLENRIGELEDRLQTREKVMAEIRLLQSRNPSGSLTLKGTTPALAAAELQSLVNSAIENAHGIIEATAPAQPEPMGPYLEVGLRVDLQANIESVREILLTLENATPTVIVTLIDAEQFDDLSQTLRVSLVVKGFAAVAAG